MKTFKRACLIVLVIVIVAAGVYVWHTSEMNSLNTLLQEEQARKNLMNERIQDIQEKLKNTESEKQSLSDKLEAMLVEEEFVFDSEAMLEEIQNIGELATVEYRFTNAATMDSVKRLSFVDLTVPFSRKTAVVTMDGVIKVGMDVSEVDITVNETKKEISVQLPDARILSTELFEDTMNVYIEEESVFSNITLEDSSLLREEIKEKAIRNAVENGLLLQARDQAGLLIRCLIEAVPSVKENYTVVVQPKNQQ